MDRHGQITLPFGTEERAFRLGIGELRKIEERCDAGAPELLARLAPIVRAIEAKLNFRQMLQADLLGRWRVDDVREVLLQGLIGAGMGSTEAGILIRAQFDEQLAFDFAPIAFLVLQAAWTSPPDDPPGEMKATPKKPARRRSAAAAPASHA